MKLCDCKHFSECQSAKVRSKEAMVLCQTNPAARQKLLATNAGVRNVPKGSVKTGDILSEKLKGSWLTKIPGLKGGCQSCKDLQEQMNRQGFGWCERNKERILGAMIENGSHLFFFPPAITRFLIRKNVGNTKAQLEAVLDLALNEAKEQHSAICSTQRCNKPRKRKLRKRHWSNSFKETGTTRFLKSSQFQEDILDLVGKLPSDLTAICGVARSGLSAATMVSMYLHLPLIILRQTKGDLIDGGNGWRMSQNELKHVNPDKEHVAVIDDTVMTGNSFQTIKPILKDFKRVTRAAVYVNPAAVYKPDIWAVDLGWPHLLEWNLFNSVLSPNMATDFDGILCKDCRPEQDDDGPKYLDFIRNAEPRYLTRSCSIPLIVTARIEKYRAETMAWLHRHGVSVHKLVMHPAKTLAERQRDDIIGFKARHFREWASSHNIIGPPPLAFIESEPWQAHGIAERTGRMVICPSSAQVFNGKQ